LADFPPPKGTLYSTASWTFVEMNVAVTTACLPTMRPIVRLAIPRILPSMLRSDPTSDTLHSSNNHPSSGGPLCANTAKPHADDLHALEEFPQPPRTADKKETASVSEKEVGGGGNSENAGIEIV
jgi:hypothetical protein